MIIVADLTRGSGHFNLAQGAVVTAQSLGAALSTTLVGSIVVRAGYSAAFLTLGAIAAGGFLLYLLGMPETLRLNSREPEALPAPVAAL